MKRTVGERQDEIEGQEVEIRQSGSERRSLDGNVNKGQRENQSQDRSQSLNQSHSLNQSQILTPRPQQPLYPMQTSQLTQLTFSLDSSTHLTLPTNNSF